ncbi:MoaD/ThiS family protein [Myxococcota bacterium]|nr:MoaD/ThiS family protein [Myxococcota bacterium]
MLVHVRLFANLRDRFPRQDRGRGDLELPHGSSLQDVIDALEIPDRYAQMVLVDGQQSPRPVEARRAVVLAEGQVVSIFPPLAGG